MADTKIVGGKSVVRDRGREHEHHDECNCHVDHKTIGGKGTRHHPFEVIGLPGAQPFALTTTVIYARPNGSDSRGDGKTPETAYATLQRAVLDVPLILEPSVTYYIDITGLDETLPDDYTLPAWKAPVGRHATIPPYDRYFFSAAAVNIVAVPQPTPGLGADGIINFGDGAISFDPITDLYRFTFTVPRPALVGAEGKRLVVNASSSDGVANGIITSVGPGGTYVETASSSSFSPDPSDYPLTVMDLSASLHGSGFQFGTLNVFNVDCIRFAGVDIHSDVGNYGLYAEGLGTTITEMCDLDGPHICTVADSVVYASSFNRILCSHVTSFCEFANSLLFVQSFGENLLGFGAPGVALFTPCHPIITNAVFLDCEPIEVTTYGPGTGQFFPAGTDQFHLQNCLVKGGAGDGVIFHGNVGLFSGVDVQGKAGSGIVFEKGAGVLQLINCGSSAPNGNFGITITDGGQVAADVATTTNATPLTGSLGGDISLGSVGPVTWATVAAPPNNVADFAGPSATGARISQQ